MNTKFGLQVKKMLRLFEKIPTNMVIRQFASITLCFMVISACFASLGQPNAVALTKANPEIYTKGQANAVVLTGTNTETYATKQSLTSGPDVTEWASGATATSEQAQAPAIHATGPYNPENLGTCDDFSSADSWAPVASSNQDILTLTYDTPVYATSFTIYGDQGMNWYRMWLKNSDTKEQILVFEGDDENCISTHTLAGNFWADTVILETHGWGWCATDAVQLCGNLLPTPGVAILCMDDLGWDNAPGAAISVVQANIDGNVDLCLNVIPDQITESAILAGNLTQWNTTQQGLIEIGQHGWQHDDEYMSTLDYGNQTTLVQNGLNALSAIGIHPKSFTPPSGYQNADTLLVLGNLSFHTDLDCYVGLASTPNILVLKQCACLFCDVYGAEGPACNFKSTNVLMADMDTAINSYGYALVAFHVQDFTDANENLNTAKLTKYTQVLGNLTDSGKYQFMTPEEYYQLLNTPTVTIDQAAGQADPTNTSPIDFTVVFSVPVSDFDTGDVTLDGTAGATTGEVTGSGTTYNVAVSGMTSWGTVIASIDAGVAHSEAGNPNAASTSTDNTVTYDNIAPTVTTDPASAVTPTSATLNGNLTSRGTASSVDVSFKWGLTESYGNETEPLPKTGIGTFSAPLSSLTPDTTYHFRAKAVYDGTTTIYGDDVTFKTGICQWASGAIATSEQPNALASYATGAPNAPNIGNCGDDWQPGYSWAPVSYSEQAILTLTYDTPVYATSFTIYGDLGINWYRMWLKNSATEEQSLVFEGDDENCISTHTFDGNFLADTVILQKNTFGWCATDAVELCGTLAYTPPEVTTDPASAITTNSATLNGNVTSLGTATSVDVSFKWGLTDSYGNETDPQTVAAGSFSANLDSLVPDTTYHYKAKAIGNGTAYGNDMTFTTGTAPPEVTTDPASAITTNSATLNGNVTSLGTATSVDVSFEWGLTQSYGNETTPQTVETGPFNANLDSLIPDTTYHYKAKAVGNGTVYGQDMTFTTGTTPPEVTTDPASDVTTNSATLNGNLTSLGTATSVDVSFEWGLTQSYGNETTAQALEAIGLFSANLDSLAPGTTYHYKAKAVGNGTAYGQDMTFNTAQNLYQIKGVTGEVNCAILPAASVDLYSGAALVGNTTSDSNGNYTLTAPQSGTYQVVISKSGFRGNSTQGISITGTGEYTLDFTGETGLVPNAPDMSYALACINHWIVPKPPCDLTMSKVLEVINAWIIPN